MDSTRDDIREIIKKAGYSPTVIGYDEHSGGGGPEYFGKPCWIFGLKNNLSDRTKEREVITKLSETFAGKGYQLLHKAPIFGTGAPNSFTVYKKSESKK